MNCFRLLAFGMSITLGTYISISFAQSTIYPDKPIKIVVAFAPGGFTDNLARTVSQKLATDFSQPVLVENKPGATGTIGSDFVAKAKSDGYTLLLSHFASVTVAPAIYPKLPYDTLTDFTPIIRLASTPMVLAVNASLPVNNLAEFVEYVRKRPDEISFASSGSGTAQQLAAVQFMQVTKTKMIHVPYKGSGPAMTDLLGGQIQVNFDSPPNVLPQLKSGKLKVLAVTSLIRLPMLPDVPTFNESGYP
jgi:tripartite-type tricarboxylate transporter receptor subunit TctC